ncbi:NirD/YgiW/YdeI family stress tolerance protein [Alloalcanivorax sp. C16-2]|uniref:NirD/YgiW/YdeI family stress tolerance protein n=1 Tax=Alloalcanivorax TaxID=3020832 RepID=UPI000C452310|nr:NirD/YgiW/YdeI family stress tolerance protein [Alloalcanivorax marinus]MBI54957.1 DNA-binding protein [Alcanivorax sp.]MBL7250771.1 NirD/YgiW/YdeI family stress tolerance protein [Alloalcanivorax marinus]HCE40321.1 DNA-binding protein [Alcanivorax sp.]|tara:strand:+ start:146 stop:499 length:354 start_codon:yes stop_codon:yes gene_type:complete
MKKLIIAAALAGTFSVAHAGDAIQADSAAIKQGIEEGKMVHLSGEVVQVMEDEHYLLRDTAGTIEIELDTGLTGDRQLQTGTRLDLVGEVDHDDGRTLVDVEEVNAMQGSDAATIDG